jgi:hypothetical protein
VWRRSEKSEGTRYREVCMVSVVEVCFTVGENKVGGWEELKPSWDDGGGFTTPKYSRSSSFKSRRVFLTSFSVD